MLVFDCSVAAVAASAAFVAAALIAKAAEAMLRLVLSWLLSWVMVNLRPEDFPGRPEVQLVKFPTSTSLIGQPNKSPSKLTSM